MPECVSYKTCGTKCNKRVPIENGRCGVHERIYVKKGPTRCALDELKYRYQKEQRRLGMEPIDLEMFDLALDRLRTQYRNDMREIRVRGNADDGIRELDNLARQRAVQERREREEIRRLNRRLMWEEFEFLNLLDLAAPVVLQPPVRQQLGTFALDPQNVHTQLAVQKTIRDIQKILTISVPLEYRWSIQTCSKTIGEIILHCNLTPSAALQMTSKYCNREQIYDLQEGIYGKVLDGVWQFIQTSSDKEDLYKILKSEMQDNIGMCSQGNLSRLVNILSGYVDGIGSEETISDKLGRQLPNLLHVVNVYERMRYAVDILLESKLEKSEWMIWITPLFDEFDETEITVLLDATLSVHGSP
jgi:hypothetical protein